MCFKKKIDMCVFSKLFVFQNHNHKWWKWQAKFQYFLHQFTSQFFFPKWLWIQLNIKFNLINWIQIHFQMELNFIQCILIKFSVIESKLNWIWIQFKFHAIMSHIQYFELNFQLFSPLCCCLTQRPSKGVPFAPVLKGSCAEGKTLREQQQTSSVLHHRVFPGKRFGSLCPFGDGELGRLKNFFLYLLLLQKFPQQKQMLPLSGIFLVRRTQDSEAWLWSWWIETI